MDKSTRNIQGIIEKIKNSRGRIYYTSDMEGMASEVLSAAQSYKEKPVVTPVVAIAKEMGFDTFQGKSPQFLSGCIAINRKYRRKFRTDRVIFTSRDVHPYQQRFVIAHGLAHFLFDYNHVSGTYYNTYRKNSYKAEAEKRADAFAAGLLMPKYGGQV